MPRPPGMPELRTVGQRVAWWREHRGFHDRRQFAEDCGMAYSTLASLESGDSKTSRRLHAIATKLRLRAAYLEKGLGEPEAEFPEEPPPDSHPWPFKAVPVAKVDRLNAIELKYAEDALADAIRQIEAERRKSAR